MTRAWNQFSPLYDVSEEPTALSAHARYMRAIVSDYPLMNDDERSRCMRINHLVYLHAASR